MKKLLMVLAFLPLMAAAETEKVGNITWSYSISEGKATVEGANPCSGSITIPSLLGGCSVTGIGFGAFLYCRALTSVMIPAGVASIGELAFSGCDCLSSIRVDEGNISYCSYEGVLYNKDKTELIICPRGKTGTMSIPSSVKRISSFGMADCRNLTRFEVDDGSVSYDAVDGMLYDRERTILLRCPGKRTGSVVIPDTVVAIEDFAFDGCAEITSVKIPQGVTRIGSDAFFKCTRLDAVSIPKSVREIGAFAFNYCTCKLYFEGIPPNCDQGDSVTGENLSLAVGGNDKPIRYNSV